MSNYKFQIKVKFPMSNFKCRHHFFDFGHLNLELYLIFDICNLELFSLLRFFIKYANNLPGDLTDLLSKTRPASPRSQLWSYRVAIFK
jgi:hypothetical protein